jgi:type II secretory pathway component HofQ
MIVPDYINVISKINAKITAISDQINNSIIAHDYSSDIDSINDSIADLEDQNNNSMIPIIPMR